MKNIRIVGKICEKIRCYMMSISLEEQKKRKLICYKRKVRDLQEMEAEEMDVVYIDTKTEYEQRNIVLPIFIFFAVLILRDIREVFCTVIRKLLQNIVLYEGEKCEVAKIVLAYWTVLILFLVMGILLALILYIRRMRRLHRY